MRLSEFDYNLPKKLIAQRPLRPRHSSSLMVLNGQAIENKKFLNLPEYLDKNDTLVLNDSRVIPARLHGRKDTGGKVELLLLRRMGDATWECLAKGRKLVGGTKILFREGLTCVVREKKGRKFIVDFKFDRDLDRIIERIGEMPTPPYIKRKLVSKEEYQTIYARHDGSIAAPTAGFHFTRRVLNALENKGVNIAYITLHVGLGTFEPVRADNIERHQMEAEYFRIDEGSAETINETMNNGGRLIAVGTTTVRALESAASKSGRIKPMEGYTDLFIYPGYEFKSNIHALLTNFHLPKSTLLMLVSAFAGRERILAAYMEAVARSYRFYSFGDAMLILR